METTQAAPKKGGLKTILVFLVLGAVALAAGVAAPMFFLSAGQHGDGKSKQDKKGPEEVKRAYVVFGDVVVNLNEDRLTRYLRVKIILVVDSSAEQETTELVLKNKPALKNWLLAYLSDRSLHEVSGASGVNKLRREIWHEFNRELFPDGSEKIRDIFFEEFVVQ